MSRHRFLYLSLVVLLSYLGLSAQERQVLCRVFETDADLRRFQNLLNNRPRKNLNYKTPNEVIKNIILEKLH